MGRAAGLRSAAIAITVALTVTAGAAPAADPTDTPRPKVPSGRTASTLPGGA